MRKGKQKMLTLRGLTIYAAALAMLTGCQMTAQKVSGTETALCDAWQDSLPTRSRADTEQTKAEIWRLYKRFEAVCQRTVK